MGIYDILQEHNMTYKDLTNLIYQLGRCVFLDTNGLVNQLDKIYDDDEYRRDFPTQPKKIYMVRLTEPCNGYDQFTIAVFDNKEQAVALARKLNLENSIGALITKEGDFITQDDEFCDWDNSRYYEVGWCELNNDKITDDE